MKTVQDLIADARIEVDEVNVAGVKALLDEGTPVVLFDVRDPEEYRQGHIEGAQSLSRGFLEIKIESLVQDRGRPIVLVCLSGQRSLLAAKVLKDMGYENVRSMSGGMRQWQQVGYPMVRDTASAPDQLERYSRQTMLAEIGREGQQKLLRSKVLMIGAGGLGSPAALYLAAAGVGTMGIIDGVRVDFSNLHRQILHHTMDVGRPKVESAREMLFSMNPDVKVVTYQERLCVTNVLPLFEEYDLIVDGTDNFQTRYLVNDACVLTGKPQVHGSILQFQGMATTFVPGKGPCYRCIYPEAPPPELVPSCGAAGVLGVLPGTIGLVQATEAIKLLVGFGEPLIGRVLAYDAIKMRFREMRFTRDPECAACGSRATIRDLSGHDPNASCRIAPNGASVTAAVPA